MSTPRPYLCETEAPTRAEVDALAGLTLLEFGTDWCGHCRAAQSALAEALSKHPQWRHLKVEDGKGRRLGAVTTSSSGLHWCCCVTGRKWRACYVQRKPPTSRPR